MASRVRKQNEGPKQQIGPMKAFNIGSSILRQHGTINAISPPFSQGHRSPGAMCYKGKTIKILPSDLRRTASLDNLRPFVNDSPYSSTSLLHLDKATQTEESFLDKNKPAALVVEQPTPSDIKMEKVIRQRLQRTHRENSVSSQTSSHSPMHSKASPVSIPPRCPPPNYMRPMRNSVEGLNQEIEKLVLYPGQPHTCRRENSHMFSRGTPEGPDLFQGDTTRSVNTQTPIMLSSDESPSTTPEEGTLTNSASPRINKFLAREPPDGCEKVNLKLTETDFRSTNLFKPCNNFQLRPSLGSAFQPLHHPLAEMATVGVAQIITIATEETEQDIENIPP